MNTFVDDFRFIVEDGKAVLAQDYGAVMLCVAPLPESLSALRSSI
jgi:hypothetical protein